MTHHLPSQQCVAPQHKDSPLNPFFVCDMEDLILERQPSLWLFGHTHSSVDIQIGKTRLLCNPFGYADYEANPLFSNRLIIEV